MAQRERKTKRLLEAEEALVAAAGKINWLELVGLAFIHSDGDGQVDAVRDMAAAHSEHTEAAAEHGAYQARRTSESEGD